MLPNCTSQKNPTSSAPKVMIPSVQMAGSTEEPSGMRATRENRKTAASSDRRNRRAPAKKKLPAGGHDNRGSRTPKRQAQARHTFESQSDLTTRFRSMVRATPLDALAGFTASCKSKTKTTSASTRHEAPIASSCTRQGSHTEMHLTTSPAVFQRQPTVGENGQVDVKDAHQPSRCGS